MNGIMLRIAEVVSRLRGQPKVPDLVPRARTGDARYVPQISHREKGRDGRTSVVHHRTDNITYQDLDRVRMYPVIVDAVSMFWMAVHRAKFHCSCSRQEIADLVMQELGDKIPDLNKQLIKGSICFGFATSEIRWQPKFDVKVSSSQANISTEDDESSSDPNDAGAECHYPFIWTVRRFAHMEPADLALLIDQVTGDFAGVEQRNMAKYPRIRASKLIHFVHDQEYDSLFGMPRTKATVPFVEVAESIWDSMSVYAMQASAAIKEGRYPDGMRVGEQSAGEYMLDQIDSIQAGHSIVMPSRVDMQHGTPLFDFKATTLPSDYDYPGMIRLVHEIMRLAMAFPEMASAQTPTSGTYNLGEVQIDLFLANIEAYLEQLTVVLNEQLIKRFVEYNFGADAPSCTIVFEPLSAAVRSELLKSLLSLLESGYPVEDADGHEYAVDWPKLAEDLGIPLRMVPAKTLIKDALLKRLATPERPEDSKEEGEQDSVAASAKVVGAGYSPAQKRDKYGKWSTEARILANEAFRNHEEDGAGSTTHVMLGNMAGRPFVSVSIRPELSLVAAPGQLSPALIEGFVRANWDLLSTGEHALGTWVDQETQEVWIDVVDLVSDHDEAIQLAQQHNQIAVWDLRQGVEIPTGGTGEVIE